MRLIRITNIVRKLHQIILIRNFTNVEENVIMNLETTFLHYINKRAIGTLKYHVIYNVVRKFKLK